MPKKRVVLNIEQSDYARLLQDARGQDMTVSNYIRAALALPLEHQGRKRADEPAQKKVVAAASTKVGAKKAKKS